jgi:hypothetical protein
MKTWKTLSVGMAAGVLLWSGIAWAQSKSPACSSTPVKLDGQVVKVDVGQGKLSVREADGTVHEFQADKQTLEGYKVGDHITAQLREAPQGCK